MTNKIKLFKITVIATTNVDGNTVDVAFDSESIAGFEPTAAYCQGQFKKVVMDAFQELYNVEPVNNG